MTDIISTPRAAPYQSDDFAARLRKRYAAERRFKMYGVAAIGIALGMLAVLLASIVSQGYTAFAQHDLALEIYFDPAEIDPQGTRDPAVISGANYAALARQSLQAVFPEVESRTERRRLNAIVSNGAGFELPVERHGDVKTLGSRGLDPARKTEFRERVPEPQRRIPQHTGIVLGRIEIEDAHVRVIQVRSACRPHVGRNAVLVRDPEQ